MQQIPEFPEIPFELGWRKIIDKSTQERIIEQVKIDTYHINPKIWLGIRWLSIYIAVRPGELLKIKEDDIDINMGVIFIPHPKEKRPKTIDLLPEDIEIIKSMPRSLPHLRFFRHVKGVSGVAAGRPFGDRYLYKHWKNACDKLGVEGVDLYGGTRHSTATALREYFSPEEIRRNGTRHSSKAFERYLQAQNEDSLQMAKVSTQITRGNVVSIKKARQSGF